MTLKNRPDRKGLAIVPALVCLLLVSLLCAAMIKLARTQRNAARDEQGRMQVEWLAESGASRASARLAADQAYRGETWNIPAVALGGVDPARVTIAVEPVKDQPARRRVRIEAEIPAGDLQRARQKKWIYVNLEKKESARR